MKSESRNSSEIVRAIGKDQRIKMFRNNMGVAKQANGSVVRYGVGPNGASDYIGWTTVEITPDMVGKKVAVFTAIEMKSDTGRVRPEQEHWIGVVNASGGRAGIARTPSDAMRIAGLL